MKYTLEIRIDRPCEAVFALFEDPAQLPLWQGGLVGHELIDGQAGEPGARSRLSYQIGKKSFEMIETLLERDPPRRLRAVYQGKGVRNEVDNRFSDGDDPGTTLWQVHTEFRCTGLMWLVSLAMPGMFRTQTETYMRSFRNFAEGGPLG